MKTKPKPTDGGQCRRKTYARLQTCPVFEAILVHNQCGFRERELPQGRYS